MKRILYIALLLGSMSALAQVPQVINYQGIARRASGSTINTQTLGIQFTIRQGASSAPVFTEAQTRVTSSLGLFTAQIGAVSSLSVVNWSNGPYFLDVGIDTTGGTQYVPIGAQQLVSVPYALSAPSPAVSYSNSVLTVGDNSITLTASGSTQSLSLSGNTLSITGGTPVVLPSAPVTSVTGSGASSVSSSGGTYNVHSDSVMLYTATNSTLIPGLSYGAFGIAQLAGSYPNYTIIVAPDISYDAYQGVLTIASKNQTTLTLGAGIPAGASTAGLLNYSYSYPVAPNVSLSSTFLKVGPNPVDLAPIAPWRQGSNASANTVTLGQSSPTQSVGINNTIGVNPGAELEVTGYTKLGGNSSVVPAIKTATFSGNMSATAGNLTTITLTGVTSASQILSISVMVEKTSGNSDWINPGNVTLGSVNFGWHVNGSTVEVTADPTTGTGLSGHAIRVFVIYGP